MVSTLNTLGSLLANKREKIDLMYISHFKRAGAPRRSGMYAKRQDFVRCLLRLRLFVFPELNMIALEMTIMITIYDDDDADTNDDDSNGDDTQEPWRLFRSASSC